MGHKSLRGGGLISAHGSKGFHFLSVWKAQQQSGSVHGDGEQGSRSHYG